jgi:hypothetical protein
MDEQVIYYTFYPSGIPSIKSILYGDDINSAEAQQFLINSLWKTAIPL